MRTINPTPRDGVDRCDCGCKYWHDGKCFDCGDKFRGRKCEQTNTHDVLADCYAVDPHPNGWGGDYCYECAGALKFRIIDHYER